MSSRARIQLESWLKTITVRTDNVIDIGGSQNPIKDRLANLSYNQYKILDLEKPHHCKKMPDLIFDLNEKAYFNDSSQPLYYEYNKYDVAFCIEVSEYWYDPVQAILNIYNLLKTGGILYISFHFIYSIHPPEGFDYLRFTPDGADKILIKAGFEIAEHHLKTGTDFNRVFKINGMRGRKDIDHDIQGSLIKAIKI